MRRWMMRSHTGNIYKLLSCMPLISAWHSCSYCSNQLQRAVEAHLHADVGLQDI
jgi:hypothetical protein